MDKYESVLQKMLNERDVSKIPDSVDVEILKSLFKENNDEENKYTCYEECTSCKGECCKSMGCQISPRDLVSVDKETIKKLLDTGMISIDWWVNLKVNNEYIGNGYYIRMRNIDSDVVDASWGGICSILTKTGCPLDFKHRPMGGRKLSPLICKMNDSEDSDSMKIDEYSKYDCVLEWLPYHDILSDLEDEYN